MSAVGVADIRLDQPTVFSNIWRIIYRAAENGSVPLLTSGFSVSYLTV
jgi:hypothetical protein